MFINYTYRVAVFVINVVHHQLPSLTTCHHRPPSLLKFIIVVNIIYTCLPFIIYHHRCPPAPFWYIIITHRRSSTVIIVRHRG